LPEKDYRFSQKYSTNIYNDFKVFLTI